MTSPLSNLTSAGYSFLLGIGVGAEYPCGSVAASEQSEEEGIAKNAQHRWFALATSTKPSLALAALTYVTILDTMIDLGFVISSFVPLVLFWMWALPSSRFGNLIAHFSVFTDLAITTCAPFGVCPSGWGSFPH
jgi:hypothetical protein